MDTAGMLLPKRITVAQYRCMVLDSADADGKLDPPATTDWWSMQSCLIGMYMEGLIVRRGTGHAWNRGGPWYLPVREVA